MYLRIQHREEIAALHNGFRVWRILFFVLLALSVAMICRLETAGGGGTRVNPDRLWSSGMSALSGAAALVGAPAPKRSYYVSLKGRDESGGRTKKRAFRTIARGVSALRAGDTLVIMAGDYGAECIRVAAGGKKGAPVVIKAEEAGKVVLTGSGKGRGFEIVDRSYVVIEGVKFVSYHQAVYIRRSSYVIVRKCIFLNNEAAGITLNDGNPGECGKSHDHLFSENQFLDCSGSGKGGPLCRSGIQDYGLCMYFSSRVEVLNNYFYGHHHQCCSCKEIMVDCRVANNVFEGAYYTGIFLGQNEDGVKGAYAKRSRNLVAEGNTFRPTGEYRLKAPIRLGNVTGAVVRSNFMDAPNGYSGCGVGVGSSAKDVRIYRNVIIDTASSRDNPAFRIYADCEIFNNTVAGCHTVLEFAATAKVTCRNNIFFNNRISIKTYKGADFSGSIFERNCWYPDWSGKSGADISVKPKFAGPLRPLGLNPYNPGPGGGKDRSGRPAPRGRIKLTTFQPTFVPDRKRARAYRIKKTSRCVDKGIDVGLPFTGKAPDIGAFESGK